MRSWRFVPLALATACMCTVVGARDARADDAADKRKQAATEYDAGAKAFKAKDFESAGTHFELADAAVPNAGALRQAIRARSEAGQGARAATLAVQALDRYPNDGTLVKIAKDAVEKYEIVLQKVRVTCGAPCTVSPAGLVVAGEPKATWTVYLDPGKGTITASFGDEGSVDKEIDAKPGGETDLKIDPKKKAAPPPVVDPVPVAPVGPTKVETPDDTKDAKTDEVKDPADGRRKGLSPVFFGISAAAFVGLGAATIWSGVDTINNPGQAAVKMQCANLGTACPAYQEGLAHQQRTNVLGGVTGGTAVLTIVLGIFTDWHRSSKPASVEPASGDTPSSDVAPTAIFLDRGAVFGARGKF